MSHRPDHQLTPSIAMNTSMRTLMLVLALAGGTPFLTQCAGGPGTNINAASVNRSQLASDSRVALKKLYASNPAARKLGARALGIMVFPNVTKGGLMVGGLGGNGVLIRPDGG